MTATALKIIALITMTLDHIGLILPDMPIGLRYIGRISPPIFFFCMAESLANTKNRKRYLLRLYLCGIGMEIFNRIMIYVCHVQSASDVTMNIFSVLFASAAWISILEWSRRRYGRYLRGILIIILWQLSISLLMAVCTICPWYNQLSLESFTRAIWGIQMFHSSDTHYALLGVAFFLVRNQKHAKNRDTGRKEFTAFYLAVSIIPALIRYSNVFQSIFNKADHVIAYQLPKQIGFMKIPLQIVVGLAEAMIDMLGFEAHYPNQNRELSYFIQNDYQWMMIAALPFLLLYNGKRGKGIKYFFYIYYPVQPAVSHTIATTINNSIKMWKRGNYGGNESKGK